MVSSFSAFSTLILSIISECFLLFFFGLTFLKSSSPPKSFSSFTLSFALSSLVDATMPLFVSKSEMDPFREFLPSAFFFPLIFELSASSESFECSSFTRDVSLAGILQIEKKFVIHSALQKCSFRVTVKAKNVYISNFSGF